MTEMTSESYEIWVFRHGSYCSPDWSHSGKLTCESLIAWASFPKLSACTALEVPGGRTVRGWRIKGKSHTESWGQVEAFLQVGGKNHSTTKQFYWYFQQTEVSHAPLPRNLPTGQPYCTSSFSSWSSSSWYSPGKFFVLGIGLAPAHTCAQSPASSVLHKGGTKAESRGLTDLERQINWAWGNQEG